MVLAREVDELVRRRLASLGMLRDEGGTARATRRWQSAMARAAFRLYGRAETKEDLRLPVAMACIELLGPDVPDEELARAVEVMLPIETAELHPARHSLRGGR